MALVVSLDTHAVVKELQAAGFTEAQAEAVTRAVRRGGDIDLSHLATKADLAETNGQIEALRVSIKADIAETNTRIDALRLSTKADIDALRLSTKGDIDALRLSTKGDIDALRLSTKAEIAELKADLPKWIIGLFGVQTIAVIGAIVALTRGLVR